MIYRANFLSWVKKIIIRNHDIGQNVFLEESSIFSGREIARKERENCEWGKYKLKKFRYIY